MKMFNNDDTSLKILVIGNDNILREGWCNKNEKLAFGKYVINSDAIFLTEEKAGFLGGKTACPTIAYYENDPNPIMRPELAYKYDADQVGDAVSMAAWALAKLLMAKDEKFETMMYILVGLAVVCAAGGCVIGYQNMLKLDKINDSLAAQPGIITPVTTPTPTPSSGGIHIPSGTQTITPTPTTTLPPPKLPPGVGL